MSDPSASTAPPGVVPFLWYDTDAEAAVAHYIRVLGGRVISETRQGERLFSCTFELRGQRLMALNGGPMYRHTDAFSLFVPVQTQAELDRLWEGLLEGGGTETMCGWLRDRWGVAWQVIPDALFRLMGDPDPARAQRATQAMLKMRKLDIAALERAADGG